VSDDNASGNRWEPGTTPAGNDPTSPAQPAPAPPGLRDRARRLRGNRAAQAGGVVAVLLAVGAAGFGAGWAASPDAGDPNRTGPDGHHGFPGDFAGDEDGDGQLPPGQQPDGTQPGTGSGTESGLTQSAWYVVTSGSSVSST
jgi:hypothetical protein